MSEIETRTKILDTAERLFAVDGFASTSLRAITREAKVNLAAVNYHFGSKSRLIEEVLSRLATPLNKERLRLLDEAEARAGDGPPKLDAVLAAFFGPPIRTRTDPRYADNLLVRLLGRAHADPREEVQQVLRRLFSEPFLRFGAALRRCLPHLAAEEIFWRMHFGVGGMVFSIAIPEAPPRLAGIGDKTPDPAILLERLVVFVKAGLMAPPTMGSVSGDKPIPPSGGDLPGGEGLR